MTFRGKAGCRSPGGRRSQPQPALTPHTPVTAGGRTPPQAGLGPSQVACQVAHFLEEASSHVCLRSGRRTHTIWESGPAPRPASEPLCSPPLLLLRLRGPDPTAHGPPLTSRAVQWSVKRKSSQNRCCYQVTPSSAHARRDRCAPMHTPTHTGITMSAPPVGTLPDSLHLPPGTPKLSWLPNPPRAPGAPGQSGPEQQSLSSTEGLS